MACVLSPLCAVFRAVPRTVGPEGIHDFPFPFGNVSMRYVVQTAGFSYHMENQEEPELGVRVLGLGFQF